MKECHWWLLMWNVCLISTSLRWQQETTQLVWKINTWRHVGERREEEADASSSQRSTCTMCCIVQLIIKKRRRRNSSLSVCYCTDIRDKEPSVYLIFCLKSSPGRRCWCSGKELWPHRSSASDLHSGWCPESQQHMARNEISAATKAHKMPTNVSQMSLSLILNTQQVNWFNQTMINNQKCVSNNKWNMCIPALQFQFGLRKAAGRCLAAESRRQSQPCTWKTQHRRIITGELQIRTELNLNFNSVIVGTDWVCELQ